MHAIDQPRPQELEVIDQERQRERGDRGLLDDPCARRVVSVAPIIANGNPDEMPRKNDASDSRSTASACTSPLPSPVSPRPLSFMRRLLLPDFAQN
jgi:hypothetical protein